MYNFWYDCVRTKYGERAKFCYIDTNSLIVYVKTDDNYKDIAEDFETIFDTSNYDLERPLPQLKKKVIGLIKDQLSQKLMKKFVGLRAKLIVT